MQFTDPWTESRTAQVSWYQCEFCRKLVAVVGHMQIWTSLQTTMSAPQSSALIGHMPFLPRNQQGQSTEGIVCMPVCIVWWKCVCRLTSSESIVWMTAWETWSLDWLHRSASSTDEPILLTTLRHLPTEFYCLPFVYTLSYFAVFMLCVYDCSIIGILTKDADWNCVHEPFFGLFVISESSYLCVVVNLMWPSVYFAG